MEKPGKILKFNEFVNEQKNNEAEKWSKGVEVEKGKMHKVLGLADDEKITDKYTSGKKLAQDLLKAVGNKKEATGMLAFAANVNPKDNVFDKALSAMKELE